MAYWLIEKSFYISQYEKCCVGRNTGIPYRKYAYGNLGKICFVAVKPKKVYSEPKSVSYYLWVTGLVFDCKTCRIFPTSTQNIKYVEKNDIWH